MPQPDGAPGLRWIESALAERNRVSHAFFAREAPRLAAACRQMSERFRRGGRLLAFGRRHHATDAQHVSVEFVHPVIVGKRALPALDLSIGFRAWMPAILRPEDIVMGFGPPAGDPEVDAALRFARGRGAMTFALPGGDADYAVEAPSKDPFVHQEILEILYHTLWETVHVFFEHGSDPRAAENELGETGFLYPFLGRARQDVGAVVEAVAESIAAKAAEDERLRARAAAQLPAAIERLSRAIRGRLDAGGTLLLFGNGGSATDANDWALDCVDPPAGGSPAPAISLSMEPANLSAIANDIGREAIFLRQLIAQARPPDVAIAISTSGGSGNVMAALEEARKRGLLTVALLGYDGGEIVRRGLADEALVVACDYIPRIQEIQASLYHLITERLQRGNVTAAAGHALELYGSASCPFTRELREHLEWQGRTFADYDVERDPAALARLVALTGGQRTVPVLVDGGRVVQVGWNGRGCAVAAPPNGL